jgi:transmembrane sensor
MTAAGEAARWFAALRRGVMSLEERAAYEAWAAVPENREAMAGMESLWSLLDGAPKPASLPRHVRRAIVSAIFVSSLAVTAISVAGSSHFWTALDWTNR